MLNGAPQSSVYFDTSDGVGGNTAGTAMVHLDFDDEVFVRINGDNYNHGHILSDSRGRTYFGGWLLALRIHCKKKINDVIDRLLLFNFQQRKSFRLFFN